MVILVDMDDVLEQLAVGWIEYLNDKYGTDTSISDSHEWDISKAFPTLTREQVYAAEKDDRIWDYVRPMPGAAEILQQLIADGHSIYIVTATIYQTLKTKMENVLFRFFPFLSWNQVIITSCKTMIKGDILIDDGPHNLAGGEYEKILFEAHHNRDFDESSIGAIRVRNWQEVYEAVRRIAEKKAIPS